MFPGSAAAFCGVDIQTVGVGEYVVPTIGTGVTIGEPGAGTAQAESDPTATITTLTPRRLTGNFPINREDLAKFPGMEDAWRMELSDALQNAIDVDLLTKNNKGLLDKGTDPTAPNVATPAADFLSDLYGAVDGAYATNINQIRVLYGPETYAYAGGLVVVANHPETVADKVMRVSGGVFVTDNAGAYASNRQEALVIKGAARRNAVGAMWNGVQIIRDEFSKAAEGQIKMTVLAMWDFEVIRTGGYSRKRYRTS